METIADIMKMDREKQSQPINTAEVFAWAMAVFFPSFSRKLHVLPHHRSRTVADEPARRAVSRLQLNSYPGQVKSYPSIS